MPEPEAVQLEQAVAGDAAALRLLLERYGTQVASEIRSQLGRTWQAAIDADDVMQVTYIEVFLQIGTLTSRDPAGFLGWLRRIAQHNLRDATKELARKKRPHPSKRVQEGSGDESCVALIEMLGVDSATPSRGAAGVEARERVQTALEQLPADYAQAVRLYDLEGRDIDEVARVMKRSAGAIHMLRARAHDHLRSVLGSATNFFSES